MKPESRLMEMPVLRVRSGSDDDVRADLLAVEEPLEIRIGICNNGKLEYRAVSITMRTPGDDHSLAAGFLFTEGIISDRSQISRIRNCGIPAKGRDFQNTVVVELNDGVEVDFKRLERNFYTTSSCGVCGKSSIEAMYTGAKKIADKGNAKIDPDLLHSLPDKLMAAQTAFEKTGGLHASAIFDTDGEVIVIAEDVGRHNALDKVIGQMFLAGETPISGHILMVSGRASFELVQKALMAGIPILAAIGAPSSLAVELASEFEMTLIGFVRDGRFNIYCGEERIGTGHRAAELGETCIVSVAIG